MPPQDSLKLTAAAAQLGTIGAAMAAQTLLPRRSPQPSLRRPSMRFPRRRRGALHCVRTYQQVSAEAQVGMTCLSTL